MGVTAMRIIDTTDAISAVFASGSFQLADWEVYMDASLPDAKTMCLEDMQECLDAGFSWEDDFLPVLNGVQENEEKRMTAIRSFHEVADQLDKRILGRFGRTLDVDLILYLGLCSGAGWVVSLGGRETVLLGLEKILELDWHGVNAMTGLILHELGHVYQAQYGVLRRDIEDLPRQFLWQLFTEGVAMVFEQETVGDPESFHQYDEDWKQWCSRHEDLLRRSFYEDLQTMKHENQRYFGDWVRFEGYGDTGYYLGARFVRFLLRSDSFDRVIRYDLGQVKDGYDRFLLSDL